MGFIKYIFILPIRFYQKFISPFLPARCRYYPSCSNYAIEAFSKYGIVIGLLKSVSRILRCNPLFPGGYEPVEKGWPRIEPKHLHK